jgi:hypothetical protein
MAATILEDKKRTEPETYQVVTPAGLERTEGLVFAMSIARTCGGVVSRSDGRGWSDSESGVLRSDPFFVVGQCVAALDGIPRKGAKSSPRRKRADRVCS